MVSLQDSDYVFGPRKTIIFEYFCLFFILLFDNSWSTDTIYICGLETGYRRRSSQTLGNVFNRVSDESICSKVHNCTIIFLDKVPFLIHIRVQGVCTMLLPSTLPARFARPNIYVEPNIYYPQFLITFLHLNIVQNSKVIIQVWMICLLIFEQMWIFLWFTFFEYLKTQVSENLIAELSIRKSKLTNVVLSSSLATSLQLFSYVD